jgi:hypothetical protein
MQGPQHVLITKQMVKVKKWLAEEDEAWVKKVKFLGL